MGTFYTQVLVADTDASTCEAQMQRLNRWSYVIPPAVGPAVILDQKTEAQDLDELDSLALTLSTRLKTNTVGLLNHDDDWLVLRYFEAGAFIGGLQVGHTAISLRGSIATLRRIVSPQASRLSLYAAMLRPYFFQTSRHAALAKILGLPSISVGTGYEYMNGAFRAQSPGIEGVKHVVPNGL